MSALMREWIGPAVCKQLNEALNDTAQDGQTSFSEDGIFVIRSTEGRVVQVNEVIMLSQSRDRANQLAVHQSCSSIPSIGVRFLYSDQGCVRQIQHRHLSEEAQTIIFKRHQWSSIGYHGLLLGMRFLP